MPRTSKEWSPEFGAPPLLVQALGIRPPEAPARPAAAADTPADRAAEFVRGLEKVCGHRLGDEVTVLTLYHELMRCAQRSPFPAHSAAASFCGFPPSRSVLSALGSVGAMRDPRNSRLLLSLYPLPDLLRARPPGFAHASRAEDEARATAQAAAEKTVREVMAAARERAAAARLHAAGAQPEPIGRAPGISSRLADPGDSGLPVWTEHCTEVPEGERAAAAAAAETEHAGEDHGAVVAATGRLLRYSRLDVSATNAAVELLEALLGLRGVLARVWADDFATRLASKAEEHVEYCCRAGPPAAGSTTEVGARLADLAAAAREAHADARRATEEVALDADERQQAADAARGAAARLFGYAYARFVGRAAAAGARPPHPQAYRAALGAVWAASEEACVRLAQAHEADAPKWNAFERRLELHVARLAAAAEECNRAAARNIDTSRRFAGVWCPALGRALGGADPRAGRSQEMVLTRLGATAADLADLRVASATEYPGRICAVVARLAAEQEDHAR